MGLNESVGWGIIGCGGISGKFAAGLKGLANARLVAAASRDASRAADFAKHWGFEKSYGSYEALAGDPDVDVVYVGTVHPAHVENTLLCIDSGKSVLCEKPFAINAVQAKKMIEAARRADVFLMEAMWTRF
ncbi:MAG: Gfo/Idh/MocA family oxidoreductase, partial [Candidatus Omnitrophica bacterium]|nr:Gfo/Idh/MocA family oxidoreductase [Candidatus Omnitrophota bacterium]